MSSPVKDMQMMAPKKTHCMMRIMSTHSFLFTSNVQKEMMRNSVAKNRIALSDTSTTGPLKNKGSGVIPTLLSSEQQPV